MPDADYALKMLPIVKRKDVARTEIKDNSGEVIQVGCYVTKEIILEIYDEMAAAMRQGAGDQGSGAGGQGIRDQGLGGRGSGIRGWGAGSREQGAGFGLGHWSPDPNP